MFKKTDKSNCCSHETLFREATCGFNRRSAMNCALNSGVGKHSPPTAASRMVPTRIS